MKKTSKKKMMGGSATPTAMYDDKMSYGGKVGIKKMGKKK